MAVEKVNLVLDVKESFGDLYFLGYKEKMKYVDRKKTDEVEAYECRLSSSRRREQIEVTVPLTVSVESIGFNQKVTLNKAEIDPYGRTTEGSQFAEVILRLTADTILDCSMGKTPVGNPGNNPGSNPGGKPEEKK